MLHLINKTIGVTSYRTNIVQRNNLHHVIFLDIIHHFSEIYLFVSSQFFGITSQNLKKKSNNVRLEAFKHRNKLYIVSQYQCNVHCLNDKYPIVSDINYLCTHIIRL